AGDCIRDFHVTGVQTCALPISLPLPHRRENRRACRPLPLPWKKLTGRKWWERGGGRVPPGRIQSLPPILPPSTKRENSTGITPSTLPPKWERQTGRRRERNDGRPSPRLPILPPLRLPLLPLPLPPIRENQSGRKKAPTRHLPLPPISPTWWRWPGRSWSGRAARPVAGVWQR